jgi:hypothetical protein
MNLKNKIKHRILIMVQHAFLISMIILFLHSCSWQGMIFGGIQEFIHPDEWISKPIYGCPICQTPWWGTAIYWIFFHIGFCNWILTVGCAAGMAVIWVVLLTLRDGILKYMDKD